METAVINNGTAGKANTNRITAIGPDVTNGGADTIEEQVSYRVEVVIRGSADLLLHRWNCESVEAKAKAPKGSAAKKTDDVESYVYRDENGMLCLPGEYLRQAIIGASKFRADPRTAKATAVRLVTAAIVSLTPLASLGVSAWDYEDKRRVQVKQNGLTRVRPAMKAGWQATFTILNNLPEYVSPEMLHDLLIDAGRLVGIGDFRPTYGRFQVMRFDVLSVK